MKMKMNVKSVAKGKKVREIEDKKTISSAEMSGLLHCN